MTKKQFVILCCLVVAAPPATVTATESFVAMEPLSRLVEALDRCATQLERIADALTVEEFSREEVAGGNVGGADGLRATDK